LIKVVVIQLKKEKLKKIIFLGVECKIHMEALMCHNSQKKIKIWWYSATLAK
jgi:hypothetical protein